MKDARSTTAKEITLTDFLTQDQIGEALRLYRKFDLDAVAHIQDRVIAPNLREINTKLGQENDPRYLAYVVTYVLGKIDLESAS